MTTWPVTECHAVGAMTAWAEKAPFSRAAVVLRCNAHPDVLLPVSRYGECEDDTTACGEVLHLEEWESLIRTREAMVLEPSTPAVVSGWLWVLRRGLVVPDLNVAAAALEGEGVVMRRWSGPDDGVAWLVKESFRTAVLRETWADFATSAAMAAVGCRAFTGVLAAAQAAFLVGVLPTTTRLAWLVHAYRLLGRDRRAAGYLALAARTFDDEFAARVQRHTETLPRPPCGVEGV